jgi:hypothetical protein
MQPSGLPVSSSSQRISRMTKTVRRLLLRKLTLVLSFGVACACTIYLFMSISKQLKWQSEAYDYAVGVIILPTLPEVATGIFWQSSLDPNSSTPITNSSSELQDEALVKLHNNNKNRYQYQNMLFIHVGKSGGATLRGILKIQCTLMIDARKNKSKGQRCLSQLEPESRLSQVVKFLVHCTTDPAPKGHEDADSFLFILRHPVDRAISWYNYVNPANCKPGKATEASCRVKKEITAKPNGQASKFFACFPQIEDWVLALRQDSNVSSCSGLAWKVAKGDMPRKERFSGHMYYNVRSYASRTTLRHPEKPVFVVRTEHLWQDTIDMDLSLGGNGTFGEKEGSKETHVSETVATPRKSRLLVEDIKTLCCRLIDEMDVYRELVLRAVNLGKVSAQETWQGAIQKCGASSWTELKAECAREKPVQLKAESAREKPVPTSPYQNMTHRM